MKDMNENNIEGRTTADLTRLHKKYGGSISKVEKVFEARQGRSMTVFDRYALGKMLENHDGYLGMIPEAIAQNQLGRVLPVAMDIISASYVTSIMPAIASIQPMEELVGVVFYKTSNVNGVTTFGPTGKRTWANDQHAVDLVENEILGNFGAGSGSIYLTCTGTAAGASIRKGSLIVKILDHSMSDAVLVTGVSDSDGNIYGPNGLTGTYTTAGVITVSLLFDERIGAVAGDHVSITYNKDVDANLALGVPKISFTFTDRTIRARIFQLEGQWGIVTEYALQKRFGRAMDVEIANDLRSEINAEVASAAIKLMGASLLTGSYVNHSATPPTGTSAYEHRMMYRDAIAKASNKIVDQAGKGKVSYMIIGADHYPVITSQPGYKALSTGSELGPHVCGMLDDITIIRATSSDLVADVDAIVGYRGANWFEAGVVYAPYLPFFITGTVNIGSALQNAKGAAHAAGLDVVVPEFITKITLT